MSLYLYAKTAIETSRKTSRLELIKIVSQLPGINNDNAKLFVDRYLHEKFG